MKISLFYHLFIPLFLSSPTLSTPSHLFSILFFRKIRFLFFLFTRHFLLFLCLPLPHPFFSTTFFTFSTPPDFPYFPIFLPHLPFSCNPLLFSFLTCPFPSSFFLFPSFFTFSSPFSLQPSLLSSSSPLPLKHI